MIFDVSVYLAVFALSAVSAYLFQHTIKAVKIKGFFHRKSRPPGAVAYCLAGCFFLLPVIAMYGLRYGIGTDYFSYEHIFNTLHGSALGEYWAFHDNNIGEFYVEPAYYFLNRLFLNYRLLLCGLGVLLFVLFLLAVKDSTCAVKKDSPSFDGWNSKDRNNSLLRRSRNHLERQRSGFMPCLILMIQVQRC